MVDHDPPRHVVGAAADALLAVEEHRVDDGQVARLATDALAIAVIDLVPAEDEAVDDRAPAAQHQPRLVLAGGMLKDRGAGLHRLVGHHPALLHRALVVDAGRDHDGRGAVADRGERVVEAAIALPVDGERRRLSGGAEEERRRSEHGEEGFAHAAADVRPSARARQIRG